MNSSHLEEIFSSYSDQELLAILTKKADEYTKEALEIAFQEYAERGLSIEALEKFKSENSEQNCKENGIVVSRNLIALILKITGLIEIALGLFIVLVVIGIEDILGKVISIFSSIMIGLLFIGLGEVIKIIHEINERQRSYRVRD